ncbi:hypothetical protein P280DRAFT_483192 [Massarina eburnea CBS 473.64]|uniref:Transmembrane protein n=1 Tax=Massarina eburnea CBS 473.64 TaxID=1395130 RepID=A0A6A6RPM0_9PLEO|nr:hypothetical protein P280DRAFT_483192 [Massarina eburnea CBS 473.64]
MSPCLSQTSSHDFSLDSSQREPPYARAFWAKSTRTSLFNSFALAQNSQLSRRSSKSKFPDRFGAALAVLTGFILVSLFIVGLRCRRRLPRKNRPPSTALSSSAIYRKRRKSRKSKHVSSKRVQRSYTAQPPGAIPNVPDLNHSDSGNQDQIQRPVPFASSNLRTDQVSYSINAIPLVQLEAIDAEDAANLPDRSPRKPITEIGPANRRAMKVRPVQNTQTRRETAGRPRPPPRSRTQTKNKTLSKPVAMDPNIVCIQTQPDCSNTVSQVPQNQFQDLGIPRHESPEPIDQSYAGPSKPWEARQTNPNEQLSGHDALNQQMNLTKEETSKAEQSRHRQNAPSGFKGKGKGKERDVEEPAHRQIPLEGEENPGVDPKSQLQHTQPSTSIRDSGNIPPERKKNEANPISSRNKRAPNKTRSTRRQASTPRQGHIHQPRDSDRTSPGHGEATFRNPTMHGR